MQNAYSLRTRRPSDPAARIAEVTPADDTDLPFVSTALSVATPGQVRVTTLDGSVSDLALHPGQPFAIRVRRVWTTGTSATGIRALA